MPSCSQISMGEEVRNPFLSMEVDRDLLCNKYQHVEGAEMAARRKCSVCKENSSLLYAGQALPELNPPVQGKDALAGHGESKRTRRYRFISRATTFFSQTSAPFGMASHGFTAASWTPNFTAGWDLGALKMERARKTTPKPERTPNPAPKTRQLQTHLQTRVV